MTRGRHSGFTLIEVLLAVAILTVVVSMAYTSFSSVTTTIGVSRVNAEELRLRQFLARGFQNNFSSVYIDQGLGLPGYEFVGIDDEGRDGPADSLRFASSAQLMGGLALPGNLKEVRYEVLGVEGRIGDFSLRDEEETEDAGPQLRATETPLAVANLMAAAGVLEDNDGGLPSASADALDDLGFEAPTWTVPIRTFDVQYYDGADWVDEWNSEEIGRLPWSVHVRVNFARTEAQIQREEDDRIDIEESPDFEMVIPLPAGIGRIQDGREVAAMESQRDLEERQRILGDRVGTPAQTTGGADTADGRPSAGTTVFGVDSSRGTTRGNPR